MYTATLYTYSFATFDWNKPAGYWTPTFSPSFSSLDSEYLHWCYFNTLCGIKISTGDIMQKDLKMKGLFFSIIMLFLLSVLALIVIDLANKSRSDLPVLGEVPVFNFVERSGVSFGDENMEGKINIVNFFFTTCKGPCPIMNARVAELYQKYSTTDKVRFVSISVDPKRDSLAVLKQYATDFSVTDDRWLFLRGELDEVHRVSENGFMLAGDLPTIHSTKLVLVDSDRKIRGYYDSFDEESLRLLTVHVRELLYGDGL